MKYSVNYALRKPEYSEICDVNDLNLNSDVIDAELGNHATKLASIDTGAEVNQNAFSKVQVGTTLVNSDAKEDTLNLVAGDNIVLSADDSTNSVKIESEHPLVAHSSNTTVINTSNDLNYIRDVVTDTFGHVIQIRYEKSSTTGNPFSVSYKGTIGTTTDDILTDLPTTTPKTNYGDLYVIRTAGTYNGIYCNTGDMFIANSTTPTWQYVPSGSGGGSGNVTILDKAAYTALGTATLNDNIVYFVEDNVTSPGYPTYEILLNGKSYGGGGGQCVMSLTQAQYDALSPSEKQNPNKIFVITDAPSSTISLNASNISYDNTASGSVNTNVQAVIDEIYSKAGSAHSVLGKSAYNALPSTKATDNVFYFVNDGNNNGTGKIIHNGVEYGLDYSSADLISYNDSKENSVTLSANNVQDAIDKLKKSVSDGKTLVANAITSKGVTTATTDSFSTMATNIGKISTGSDYTFSLDSSNRAFILESDFDLPWYLINGKDISSHTSSGTAISNTAYSVRKINLPTGTLIIDIHFSSFHGGAHSSLNSTGIIVYLPNNKRLHVYPNSAIASIGYPDGISANCDMSRGTILDTNLTVLSAAPSTKYTDSPDITIKYNITNAISNWTPLIQYNFYNFLSCYDNSIWNTTNCGSSVTPIRVSIYYQK